MPPKRKAGAAPQYGKMDSSKKTKYGKNGKKYSGNLLGRKLGGGSVDWNAVAKLADAAVAKNIGRTIETQRSSAMVVLADVDRATPASTAGWSLPGLNQVWVPLATAGAYRQDRSLDQLMVFNLSSLSQVKGAQGGSISGWRQGNKINMLGVSFNLRGKIAEISSDCEYHMMLVRRKDGAGAGKYLTPSLVSAQTAQLFKPMDSGPYFNVSSVDTAVPVEAHLSMTRRNTDAWSFVEKGHVSKKLFASPTGNRNYVNGAGVSDASGETGMTGMLSLDMYHSFNTVWDFTSSVSTEDPVLKGGDYYVFLWREGPSDLQAHTQMALHIDFSFKDA